MIRQLKLTFQEISALWSEYDGAMCYERVVLGKSFPEFILLKKKEENK